jgi:hypothetical protein
MDARFQEATGDFAMNLSGHRQAYRINLPDNIMPVRQTLDVPFFTD